MQEKSLLELMDFGNEAGDDEKPEVLNTYFVEQELFKKFLDPTKSILIATAKKGVGKSALLNWLGYHVQMTDTSALVIKCTGADLSRNQFKLTHELKTPNDHIRDWMTRICALINRNLASNLIQTHLDSLLICPSPLSSPQRGEGRARGDFPGCNNI